LRGCNYLCAVATTFARLQLPLRGCSYLCARRSAAGALTLARLAPAHTVHLSVLVAALFTSAQAPKTLKTLPRTNRTSLVPSPLPTRHARTRGRRNAETLQTYAPPETPTHVDVFLGAQYVNLASVPHPKWCVPTTSALPEENMFLH
jgi:hypothetical protein